jgi:hypothetical protein
MSFWDVVWFICISFFFVAYLMVMFHILGDLFRDPDESGWAKIGWVAALVLLPLVASLVYLGVRGRGMAERQARGMAEMQRRQDEYIRQVAGAPSATAQIAQAREMLEAGAISPAEYDQIKAKALV